MISISASRWLELFGDDRRPPVFVAIHCGYRFRHLYDHSTGPNVVRHTNSDRYSRTYEAIGKQLKKKFIEKSQNLLRPVVVDILGGILTLIRSRDIRVRCAWISRTLIKFSNIVWRTKVKMPLNLNIAVF